MTSLRLRPVHIGDETAVRIAQDELRPDDFTFALFLAEAPTWAAYVDGLAKTERGVDLPAGKVRSAFLVADVDGEIVGRTSIRYELTDWLREWGGHIGYAVRPAHRRNGYAREILRQSLIVARAHGVERVLITCDDDNAGSIATIEGLGGVRDVERPWGDHDGTAVRRYWID